MVILETAEKHALQHAIASLRKHQSALEQGFAGELIKAMAQDTQARAAKKSDRVARPLSSVSFDELQLIPADSGARTRWLTHGGQFLGEAAA